MTSFDTPGPGRLRAAHYAADLEARTAASLDPAPALCVMAAATLGVSGAGLALARGDALESVAVSDRFSEAIEAIEYALGEGPCVSAFRSGVNVVDPDLMDPGSVRWPAFRREALGVGLRAAFGIPLFAEGKCFGALNLYRDAAGAMTADQLADAAVVAGVTGRMVLDWQAAAEPGTLAWQLAGAAEQRVVVHQAVGRISVRASVSIADAYALLRAYAYADDRSIVEVAADVSSGALQID